MTGGEAHDQEINWERQFHAGERKVIVGSVQFVW